MAGECKIGVLVSLGEHAREEIKKVHDLGLASCQMSSWDPAQRTDVVAAIVKQACADFEV
jgi:hypothetical protein